ncbi:MAG: methionine--tRNA ligase [Candidatus Paceibacterota bacterium]|jgi:methionyl-tRNA synthetase
MTKHKGNYYITTTLPYVNAPAHVGHALEFIRADIAARYRRVEGYAVFFNTGADEHGLKIYRKALEVGQDPQAYVDEYAGKLKALKEKLNLSYDNFVRTTDPQHIHAVQEFWKLCAAHGDIYKKAYKIKYCVGCELEKTESELLDGKCPIHPALELELIDEENYFFRFSRFQIPLLDLYEKNKTLVLPLSRQNEIKAFVERGPEDFSISRLKTKMPWGVSVPGDEDHVMYVWFDALVNYISSIGWPDKMEEFNKWWPVTQYCGKDNLRQQAAMWQAMLMSASLDPSRQIIVNGFIISNGQKMSKSIGNVINPLDIVEEYGTDALRYYMAREVSAFEDADMTLETFKSIYNANLANGLGNLVNRSLKMAVTYGAMLAEARKEAIEDSVTKATIDVVRTYKNALDAYNTTIACDAVWSLIKDTDGYIQKNEPFKKHKSDPAAAIKDVEFVLENLYLISLLLVPILPETAGKIQHAILNREMPAKPLFMRKD